MTLCLHRVHLLYHPWTQINRKKTRGGKTKYNWVIKLRLCKLLCRGASIWMLPQDILAVALNLGASGYAAVSLITRPTCQLSKLKEAHVHVSQILRFFHSGSFSASSSSSDSSANTGTGWVLKGHKVMKKMAVSQRSPSGLQRDDTGHELLSSSTPDCNNLFH